MSNTNLLNLENEWKELTNFGNGLILQTREKALSKYELALEKAEKLMEYQKECDAHKIPVMPIFLISCNNLAEVYCLLENWEKADKMLKRSVYYILHLKQQQLHPQASDLLSKWFFKQLLLYKDFSQRRGAPKKYETFLERLKHEENK